MVAASRVKYPEGGGFGRASGEGTEPSADSPHPPKGADLSKAAAPRRLSLMQVSGDQLGPALMTVLRTTWMLIAALTIALSALVALPRTAGACQYLDIPLSEYADEVGIAFTGQQIGRFEPRGPVVSSGATTLLVLRVHRVFKGQTGPLITLVTVFDEGSCGIDFRERGTVAVAAYMWEGDLWVTLGDSRHTVDEFEEAFGPGYPPEGTFNLAGLFGQLVEKFDSRRPPDGPDIAAATQTKTPALSDNTPASGRTSPAVLLLIGAALIAFIGGATAWRNQRRPSDNR